MARLTQGILGGISGTIGNVVGSSWKGIAVIKSKPLSVSNPRTTAQTAQRLRMKNVVDFSTEILTTIIKPLWDRFAQQASGFNDFVRTNIALFDAAMPSPAADLTISSGKMQAPAVGSLGFSTSPHAITLSYPPELTGPYEADSDLAYAVAVNETKEKVKSASAAAQRSDESVTVLTDDTWEVGDVVHFYLAFKRADGTVVSGTTHVSGTIS